MKDAFQEQRVSFQLLINHTFPPSCLYLINTFFLFLREINHSWLCPFEIDWGEGCVEKNSHHSVGKKPTDASCRHDKLKNKSKIHWLELIHLSRWRFSDLEWFPSFLLRKMDLPWKRDLNKKRIKTWFKIEQGHARIDSLLAIEVTLVLKESCDKSLIPCHSE